MSRTTLVGVAALAVAFAATPTLVASAGAPAAAPATNSSSKTLPTEGLDILLTNDDGYDAFGIKAVYEALSAAGHNVTMVAPEKNNSGVSARIEFGGNTRASQPVEGDENIWAVDLSPASTVFFGINEVLDGEKPDLVVSGTNVGANTGFDTNFSGTIGAATVASGYFDVPSIAISTETVYGEEEDGAYAETADLLVDLLDRGLPVLPRGQFLNINYPVLGAGHPELQGIKYAPNALASNTALSYDDSVDDPETDEIEYRIVPARHTEVPAPGSDADLLKKGWVTFGVLDSDRSVDVPEVLALVRELNGDPAPPVKPGKPTVAPLPKKAKKKKVITLATQNVTRGAVVKVRWEPLGNRKAKKVTQTVKARKAAIKFKAPKQKGRYLVTLKVTKVKVANLQRVVRVK